MIYTVTFNPAVDYVLRLPSLNGGSVNRTASEKICWGGKGINVSYVLKMLGTESTAWGFAAGFTGAALTEAVKEMGISADFITLDEGFTRICVKLFETDSARETEINPGGPVISSEAIDKLLKKPTLLKAVMYLFLREACQSPFPRTFTRLSAAGLKTAACLLLQTLQAACSQSFSNISLF